jgi:hypothetical protein
VTTSLAQRGASRIAALSRPLRRRITPSRFKETYINSALSLHAAPTYLEIGVRDGESFRLVSAPRKIGVDPVPTEAMRTLRPGEEYFPIASDDFFRHEASSVLRPASVHVAQIDGLHEFRQAVRDLLNLEPYMRADGAVFFDDFNPRTRERARDTPTPGAWNGDVWKVAVFLACARPDLSYWTVDADEGIGLVVGFGGIAPGGLEDVIESAKRLDYSELERDRRATLHLIRPREFGPALVRSLRQAPT